MNEPEFGIREMDGPFHRAPHGVPLREFRMFCRAVGEAVHEHGMARFTLGTTRVRYLPVWEARSSAWTSCSSIRTPISLRPSATAACTAVLR